MKASLVVGVVIVGFAASTSLIWGVWHRFRERPLWVGNRRENVEHLSPTNGRFSFAVLGDREDSDEPFEKIMAQLQRDGCRFAVICGDVVHKGAEPRFRYFMMEMEELADEGFDRPVFAAVGNHDVEHSDRSSWKRYMGAERFFFVYGGSLFLIFDNAYAMKSEEVAWVEGVLEKLRPTVRHAFVFMHRPMIPPAGAPIEEVRIAGMWTPIDELFRRHSVTRIFAGHEHGYRRDELNGLVQIVTGGGGADLEGPGERHHYVKVDVDPSGVSDRVVGIETVSMWEETEEFLEKALVMNVYCYAESHPWLFLPLGITAVGPWVVLAVALIRRRRRRGDGGQVLQGAPA